MRKISLAIAAAAALTAVGAQAAETIVQANVLRTQDHSSCSGSNSGSSVAGGALGALLGAAIGNQIGGGSGKQIATAAGAYIGGSVGSEAGSSDGLGGCRTGYVSEVELDGRRFQVQTDSPPGRTIPLVIEYTVKGIAQGRGYQQQQYQRGYQRRGSDPLEF